MRLSELLEAAGMKFSGRDMRIMGISADETRVGSDFLFAVHKRRVNLVGDALAKGAAAVLLPKGAKIAEKGVLAIGTDVDNPPHSKLWSRICAAWWGHKQPRWAAAVTGSNAKSSIVSFAEQIWRHCGVKGACLGTLGLSSGQRRCDRPLTTQEPFSLHRDLATLADEGVSHLAMEASSHALVQHRLDAVRLNLGVFTNLTAEHLDYHRDLDGYFAAKARLFSQLLAKGATAIIGTDDPYGRKLARLATRLKIVEVGRDAEDFRILAVKTTADGSSCRFAHGGEEYSFATRLIGDFQAVNALFALAVVTASGSDFGQALEALEWLEPLAGRMEPVADNIFVDYAHTAAALKSALSQLRKITKGRLLVVFGAGGDRDKRKRPQMGETAARLADIMVVTDDNPRRESAAAIRRQIVDGARVNGAEIIEIADRGEAIAEAVGILRKGDTLLIAGKGHENEQLVGEERLPFNDKRAIEAAAKPLWTSDNTAFLGESSGRWRASGVSIDSRSLKMGDLFVALASRRSPACDGVRFLADAARAGAAAAIVPRSQAPKKSPLPILAVADSQIALTRLAEHSVAHTNAKVIAVTGSVGKTDTKEFLRSVFARLGKTQAAEGNRNNQLGLPLTLASLKADTEFMVLEAGMNHPGELTYLSTLARPQAVVITHIGEAHSQFFASLEEIAEAKAEILHGIRKNGVAVLPADSEFYPMLAAKSKEAGAEIITFGESPEAHARLLGYERGSATASIAEQTIRFRPPVGGRHHARNGLAALALASRFAPDGMPLQSLAAAIAATKPLSGRGGRHAVGNFTFIDESYNAAPPSMRACLAELAEEPGKKLVVLADMLELGDAAPRAHEALAKKVAEAGVEKAFLVGGEMRHLQKALAKKVATVHAATAHEIIPPLKTLFGGKDEYLILVKGSRAMRMEEVILAFVNGEKDNAL